MHQCIFNLFWEMHSCIKKEFQACCVLTESPAVQRSVWNDSSLRQRLLDASLDAEAVERKCRELALQCLLNHYRIPIR